MSTVDADANVMESEAGIDHAPGLAQREKPSPSPEPRGRVARLLQLRTHDARESGRPIDVDAVPEQAAVSVLTIAELTAGVLAAPNTLTRARRLATLEAASAVEALPVTAEAARRWAELRVRLAEQGLRAKVNDLWIAAVAQANGMEVVTQDDDFDAIERAAVQLSFAYKAARARDRRVGC